MNKQSYTCRLVEPGKGERIGDYYWEADGDQIHRININLPTRNGGIYNASLRVVSGPTHDPAPGKEPAWSWDGCQERPTLSPSLLCDEHWHGHLIQGVLKSDP